MPRKRPEPEPQPEEGLHAPTLTSEEVVEASERAAVGAHVVHEAIRKEAEAELARPTVALMWSGLGAGLSMGFSLLTEGLLRSHLPDEDWRPLITKLGYSVGFLIVILGRQQLFTENTITPILSLFTRRDAKTAANVARLWGVVLVANFAGAALFALALAHLGIEPPPVEHAFAEIGREASRGSFGNVFVRAIFAGWLIALLVWLLPAAETARVPIIVIMTFIIGLATFPHIIAGAIEVFYSVLVGDTTWSRFIVGYAVPTLLGNIVGGVLLVAALNYAQSLGRRAD